MNGDIPAVVRDDDDSEVSPSLPITAQQPSVGAIRIHRTSLSAVRSLAENAPSTPTSGATTSSDIDAVVSEAKHSSDAESNHANQSSELNEPSETKDSATANGTINGVSPSNSSGPSPGGPVGSKERFEVREWQDESGTQRVNMWGELIAADHQEERVANERKYIAQLTKKIRQHQERELKWKHMVEHWSVFTGKKVDVLKRRIRKGIPDSFRGKVWPMLTGALEAKQGQSDLYYALQRRPIPEADDLQLRKDLPREFQNHVLFRSPVPGSREVFSPMQATMYRVFHAWSVYDKNVGYVQGMGSIVGLCLMYVTEDDAFWMLQQLLMSRWSLLGLYTHGMPLAHKLLFMFDTLLQKHVPALAQHLQKEMVHSTAFAFRWFTMRFAEFPKPLVVRIFDIFLFEGDKILFRMALFLMMEWEKRLLKLDFEGLMMQLQGLPDEPSMIYDDEIIESALKVDITNAQLERLAEQWDKQQAAAQFQRR